MKILKTELIIIAILWLSIIASLYFNYKFDFFFILAIIGLSVSTVTYKKQYEISLSVLFFLLLFSVFNIAKFSLAFGLNFGVISIPSFLIFIVICYKRRNELLNLKTKWFAENNEEIENHKDSRVEFFKKQFKKLSIENLESKLRNEKLTDEAQKAISELLKSKN